MTTLLERPPALNDALTDIQLDEQIGVLYPLHPFDENPIELGLTLKAYPAEQTVAMKALITDITLRLHESVLTHAKALIEAGVSDINVQIPRATTIPNLIGQETMSALGIARSLMGLQTEQDLTDSTVLNMVNRK